MNDQATLHAGGLVPTNSKLGSKDSDAVDTVVARAYVHPVMPNRTVVRLCAEGVTAGDELEMATLGFGPGVDRGAVGKERKRPLGFPGWALVHDPENARYALDVVKQLKKHARKAKSKPGHAKEEFDAIAAQLGKTVPHFLPSFYEEVGRVFIEHGALTYAAAMFGKARQVEAVHALEVDEQHRIDAFLEFALAGAVTTKALSEYGKELSAHHEPKVAYAHFRQLCVQRTLGGMPPWSGMAKDLGRLAKAAKLDVDAEDAALISEIIESPALAKAAAEFWRAYAEPIAALGKASPAIRGVLLNLFPTGTTNANPELDDTWLDLLEATGAIDALFGDVPPEAAPTNGRAAWFDKLCAHVSRGWRSSGIPVRVFGLLRKMAPALIAEGKPIKASGRYRVDLDLAELALELGVAVESADHHYADGNAWAATVALPERGRDPVRCAAHPKLKEVLSWMVAQAIGNAAFDAATAGKQGFLTAKRDWLEAMIAAAERGALPAIDSLLATITQKCSATTFAELPELHARFAALDVAAALARTLQVGLIDELGWPALEEAIAELSPDGKVEVELHGAPAATVIASKTRAIAIVGNERKGVHDFVIPPKHVLITARLIGDQFLVVLKEGHKVRAYWSTSPHDLWEGEALNAWNIPTRAVYAVARPDGAWIESGRAVRAGDRVLPFGKLIVAADATTAWVHEWSGSQHRWREVASTGELGRFSWPAWIEAYSAEGTKLDTSSHYLPAPAGVTASPLGVVDGFTGARIRVREADQHRELETIDGARLTSLVHVTELLALPDGGARRPLVQEHSYGKPAVVAVYDPTAKFLGSKLWGGDPRYVRGQVAPLTLPFFHLYTARDVAGSRRIHAATDDDARALIAAAAAYAKAAAQPVADHPPDDLPSLLPEVTHPRLRRGIAGVALAAAELVTRRDELARERAPGARAAAASVGPQDAALLEALPGWLRQQWAASNGAWAQIERTGAVFADAGRSYRAVGDLGMSPIEWFDAAVMRAALPVLAVAIGTPVAMRPVIAKLYEHLCKTMPSPAKLRVLRAQGDLPHDPEHTTRYEVRWHGGNAYAIRLSGYSGNIYQILEYAPTGTFVVPWGLTTTGELVGADGGPSPDEVHAAVAAGQTSWSEDAAARLAADTGLTPSEAAYLWAGCPKQTDRGTNFLDKELREQLGLKAAQAALARDALTIPKFFFKIAALADLGRGGLGPVLDGSGAATLAAAWKQRFGARVAIPESLVAKADALDLGKNIAGVLATILGGAESPQLTVDVTFAFDTNGTLIRTSRPEPLIGQTKLDDSSPHFEASWLTQLAIYLPFLYAELPVGDPLRAQAVVAYELAQQRLASPTLWLTAGSAYLDNERCAAIVKQLEAAGGQALPGIAEHRALYRLPGGAVMVAGTTSIVLCVRPVELDAKALAWVEPLTGQLNSYLTTGKDLAYLRSPELRAMMARITETPVAAGGWEQNPLQAVPGLVDKVMKRYKLSREAAGLYLQYLVLLWPTPKALAEYNGWKPTQLAAAQAELVERELVLEAKRERAQRGHFLPGGWEALKSPHPPHESWKQPLYSVRPGGKLIAAAPFHALFERAWQRLEDGDEPRYEEVKR